MDKIFTVKDFNLFYGDKQALKNINMDISLKKITAFIGPSGCGKSTLLRSFNRMNDFISSCKIDGEINYEGNDIYGKDNDTLLLRTEVGMVFQNPNPFPMNIFDNVAFGPRCQGLKDKKKLTKIVINALKQAAIYDEVKDRLKDSALTLSGGQQQRLCIARALAMKPKVILLDEPTSALDPIATSKIEDLILELKKHYTIIIVTHNMQQAARISDYTAFFYLGELIEYKPTKVLFSHPELKQTEAYITGRFG